MTSIMHTSPSSKTLAEWVCDARQRTLALVADLNDEQLLGPRLSIVNPLLWEIGHIAWFQEKWVLRHASKQPPIRRDADALYDEWAAVGVASNTQTGSRLQGPPIDTDYGMREFALVDPTGNLIRVGSPPFV